MSRISWKSIIAGAIVTVAVYSTLLFLGLGVGASSAYTKIQEGGSLTDLSQGTAAWIAIATLISLTAGGFFATRNSAYATRATGAAHGFVVASLFLSVMLYGLGSTVGAGISGMATAVQSTGSTLISSPMVQNVVEDGMANIALKSDVTTVVKGLVSRLATGNTDAARAYLVSQANAPASVVEAQFTQIETQFRETAKNVASTTAQGVAASAYGMFWISFLGILCACAGGAYGSHLNLKRPIVLESVDVRRFETRTAV